MARRTHGTVVDLGCGSGRLFGSFLAGGARRILGIDGSPALLERARVRIEADAALRTARDAGRISLERGDVRTIRRSDRAELVVLAGLVAHLDGPEDAVRALDGARRLLARDGLVVIDHLGPGGVPPDDLGLSIDWEREMGDRHVVRRSRLTRRETPEGVRVDYSTLTDVAGPDGTIARLPAGFRLWYPSPGVLIGLAEEAQLAVEATYGSHDLDPLGDGSERCIIVLRTASASV
jgi:SAM-dependent methyltransferase